MTDEIYSLLKPCKRHSNYDINIIFIPEKYIIDYRQTISCILLN